MGVRTRHPEYEQKLEEWELVKACCDGWAAIKRLREKILPPPDRHKNDSGQTVYDINRYEDYLNRAIYTNVTGKTKIGLTGAAFRNNPSIQLPSGIEYLANNCDGGGLRIDQLSKHILSDLFESGREILLVDYPAGMSNGNAYIKRYDKLSLINWKIDSSSGVEQLVMAVLLEYIHEGDEFSHDTKEIARVLRLNGGVYTQQVYTFKDQHDNEGIPGELITPLDYDGQPFNYIPLMIIGSETNNARVDPIPISDIAHLNIGHFLNSADLEENNFISGQLTLGVSTDISASEWREANPNGVIVGSRSGHYLGPRGSFSTVQASPNQLGDVLMERKEKQMLLLGAKLIEKANPNITATTSKIDATGENSVLATMVSNVEDAIKKCIEWASKFMGVQEEATFIMNREFFPEPADSQLVMAGIQLYDRKVIAVSDLRSVARDVGIVEEDRTDEDIENELVSDTTEAITASVTQAPIA